MDDHDDGTHIEACSCCQRPVNVLHTPSWVQDHAGRYYHNAPDCVPHANALRFTFTPGNGLASR